MTAVMLGTSLVAQRAQDIQRGFRLLESRAGVDRQRIYGAAQGNAAAAMLHAAAAGVPLAGLLLDGMLASYRSVTESPIHKGIFESIVPGAIGDYDLPGLAALLAPGRLIVVDAISPMGQRLPAAAVRGEYKSVAGAQVVTRAADEPPAAIYPRLIE
jgi:hypothetical protein